MSTPPHNWPFQNHAVGGIQVNLVDLYCWEQNFRDGNRLLCQGMCAYSFFNAVYCIDEWIFFHFADIFSYILVFDTFVQRRCKTRPAVSAPSGQRSVQVRTRQQKRSCKNKLGDDPVERSQLFFSIIPRKESLFSCQILHVISQSFAM